jgi:hypothetical protein
VAKTALYTCLALMSCAPLAHADNPQVDSELKQITAWRRDLHEHPELSNRETRTSIRCGMR